MSTKENLQVTGNTLEEVKQSLNFMLQRIQDRLDKAEGLRGAPEINTDMVLNNYSLTHTQQAGVSTTIIKYVDSNGTTIHSIGA